MRRPGIRVHSRFSCRRMIGVVPMLPLCFEWRVPASDAIPVVCALIEADQRRVLIAQRPAHKHLGLKWEFPGGKVESGEAASAALVREVKEELGCDIAVVHALPRSTHDYGSIRIEMIPFVCRLEPSSAAPHPHEHAAVRWIARNEFEGIDFAAADLPVIEAYRIHCSGGL